MWQDMLPGLLGFAALLGLIALRCPVGLAMLLVGSIPGIVIGSRLTTVLDERVVQRCLAAVLFLAGLKMVLS